MSGSRGVIWIVALTMLSCLGCDAEVLDVEYGRRAGRSVNGTAAFGEMCKQAGYTVATRRVLGPELNRIADTIVWFPDDFDVAGPKQQKWLADWVTAEAGRTLIVVGRDYDAEADYWTEIQRRNLSANPPLVVQYLGEAQARIAAEQSVRKWPQDGGWYERRPIAVPGRPTHLSGAWNTGVDASKQRLSVEAELSATGSGQVDVPLSASHNGKWSPFVVIETLTAQRTNYPLTESQRIFVENGSFLLNYALVNQEHRKPADDLIRQISAVDPNSTGTIVFLESGKGGPEVRTDETIASFSTGWELFQVQPLGAFLCHLAVLGIVFCFVRWPIFGRPKEDPRETSLDFGQHLNALARLLKRTGDRGYAQGRLAQYQAAAQQKKNRQPPPV